MEEVSERRRESSGESRTAKQEWLAFLFVTVILVPLLSVAVVAGYGFVVWMLQVFVLGPPGVSG